MKLPLKTRILKYAIERDREFTITDVMQDLGKEYPGEKIFNLKQVEEYIDSYLGVGFLHGSKVEFDDKHNLVIHCSVTEYGKSRSKYVL